MWVNTISQCTLVHWLFFWAIRPKKAINFSPFYYSCSLFEFMTPSSLQRASTSPNSIPRWRACRTLYTGDKLTERPTVFLTLTRMSYTVYLDSYKMTERPTMFLMLTSLPYTVYLDSDKMTERPTVFLTLTCMSHTVYLNSDKMTESRQCFSRWRACHSLCTLIASRWPNGLPTMVTPSLPLSKTYRRWLI